MEKSQGGNTSAKYLAGTNARESSLKTDDLDISHSNASKPSQLNANSFLIYS